MDPTLVAIKFSTNYIQICISFGVSEDDDEEEEEKKKPDVLILPNESSILPSFSQKGDAGFKTKTAAGYKLRHLFYFIYMCVCVRVYSFFFFSSGLFHKRSTCVRQFLRNCTGKIAVGQEK